MKYVSNHQRRGKMFILACAVFILAGLVYLAKRKVKPEQKDDVRLVGRILVVVGIVSTVLASISSVPTRNVGIVTEFNKATGRTTGAGLTLHMPWQEIDEWDASRNTFDRLGGNCLWVSVSGGRACIAVQIEWSAKEENAPGDWAAYKETKVGDQPKSRFETFIYRRVNPQMDAAITTVFTTFNPLGRVNKETGALVAPDLNAEYLAPLRAKLLEDDVLGDSITIDSIAFGTPTYDEPTTQAISAFGQKTLEARNLAVDEENAKTRKRITDVDAQADPVARCLSIAERLGKEPGLCMSQVTVTRPVT